MKSEVFNTDCLEAMRAMDDNQFDLAIVDPPYGILNLDGLGSTTAVRKSPRQQGSGKLKNRVLNQAKVMWDLAPTPEYFEQLRRVSVNQVIWGGNYFSLPPCRGFAIWDKKQPWPNFSACEFAWSSFNYPSKLFAYDNRQDLKQHPTQKPVALYKWLLTNYAKPGDTILDTHLGSGSSRIAAYDLGFDFTGYELDKDYFDAQERRFADHIAQPKLFTPEPQIMTQGELLG